MWAFGHYLTDDAQGAHVLEHRQGVPTWGGGAAGHIHRRPGQGVPIPVAKGPGDCPEPGCRAGQ